MRKSSSAAAAPRNGARGSGAATSLVHRIRAFQWSEPANRKCADCSERGPTYICLTFQTFVCQTCSGIHRSFGHKIKGISLSDWSVKELEALEAGGNAFAAQSWLARWSASEFPEPDSNQTDLVKEFIKKKYVDKAWWKPAPPKVESGEGQDEKRPLRVPTSQAGLRPLQEPRSERKAQPAATSLLDDSPPAAILPPPAASLGPPPLPVDARPEANAQSEWMADFSNSEPSTGLLDAPSVGLLDAPSMLAPSVPSAPSAPSAQSAPPSGGLLDLDFGAASAPQPIAAPAALDFGAFGAGIVGSAPPAPAPAPIQDPLLAVVPPPPAPRPAVDQLADGLASLDFGAPPAPAGGAVAMDLFGAFGVAASPPPALPVSNPAGGFGVNLCVPPSLSPLSHVESPIMEPAEEPAPALAVNPKEEQGNIGDRLREAVLSNSDDELKHLFKECLEPPKRPAATEDRFAAFAAFDELSGGGAPQKKPEAPAQQLNVGPQHMLFGIPPPGPPPGLPGNPLGPPTASQAPGMFGTSSMDLQPPLGGLQMPSKPPGVGQGLPANPPITAMTTEQIGQLMPQGMIAPHQLEGLDQQELMQMQLMISQAMQARAQQQFVATAPQLQAQGPAAHGLAGGPSPWQLQPAPGTRAAGAATPGAPAAQAAQRPPSPPKEFGDLLAAFHARNPISGIELKA